MSDLFEAGGLEDDAPRPLADRCVPRRLPKWWGRIICSAESGPIGRMVAAKRAHSIILWGPPGTGKTTIARLLSPRVQSAFRAIVGGVFRRRRSQENIRCRARAPQDGAGHAALRRRNPSLQPQPAGFISARGGRRNRGAGRRDHGKSVFRTEWRIAFAHAGAGAAQARRRRTRNLARTRRETLRRETCRSPRTRAHRFAPWPMAMGAICSIWRKKSPR